MFFFSHLCSYAEKKEGTFFYQRIFIVDRKNRISRAAGICMDIGGLNVTGGGGRRKGII